MIVASPSIDLKADWVLIIIAHTATRNHNSPKNNIKIFSLIPIKYESDHAD